MRLNKKLTFFLSVQRFDQNRKCVPNLLNGLRNLIVYICLILYDCLYCFLKIFWMRRCIWKKICLLWEGILWALLWFFQLKLGWFLYPRLYISKEKKWKMLFKIDHELLFFLKKKHEYLDNHLLSVLWCHLLGVLWCHKCHKFIHFEQIWFLFLSLVLYLQPF